MSKGISFHQERFSLKAVACVLHPNLSNAFWCLWPFFPVVSETCLCMSLSVLENYRLARSRGDFLLFFAALSYLCIWKFLSRKDSVPHLQSIPRKSKLLQTRNSTLILFQAYKTNIWTLMKSNKWWAKHVYCLSQAPSWKGYASYKHAHSTAATNFLQIMS